MNPRLNDKHKTLKNQSKIRNQLAKLRPKEEVRKAPIKRKKLIKATRVENKITVNYQTFAKTSLKIKKQLEDLLLTLDHS